MDGDRGLSHATGPCGVSFGVFVALFVIFGGAREASVLIGAAIALLLPTMCRAELDGRVRVPSVALFMGAASYAIYLVHNPMLSVIARIAAKLDLPPLVALVPGAAVSVMGGVAYYWVYERRALAGARSLEKRVWSIAGRCRGSPRN